jgi:hypothetical protein
LRWAHGEDDTTVVSVVYELIDAPFPHLCALYRCSCGAESTRYGEDAAVPPPGWTVDQPAGGAEAEHVTCPHCGQERRQRPS